jgi:hypothetical protein
MKIYTRTGDAGDRTSAEGGSQSVLRVEAWGHRQLACLGLAAVCSGCGLSAW